MAEASRDERTMSLAGSVRVLNRSGEDYENAQVRLVVGVIRLVEEIVELAQREAGAKAKDAPTTEKLMRSVVAQDRFYRLGEENGLAGAHYFERKSALKEIVKEGVSEYFIYTVEGRDTVPNGWAKKLPSFQATEVPIISLYKFEQERWDARVMRYYRFTNSIPSRLGNEPLPDGAVMAFRLTTPDDLYTFAGATAVKYIPINETVEMELGHDREVFVKPVMLDWQKTNVRFDTKGNVIGWTTKQVWEIEIQSSKEIPVVLDIRRTFKGDWSLSTTMPYVKMDATKVKFVLSLSPREKRRLTYELVTRHGASATR